MTQEVTERGGLLCEDPLVPPSWGMFMNLSLEQVQERAKPSLQEQSRLLGLLTTLPAFSKDDPCALLPLVFL